MTRLFISLYAVIIVGIVLINWGSQALWQQFDHGKDPQTLQLEQLAITLSHSVNADNRIGISQAISIPITLLEPSDIVLLPEQQRQLNSGQVVVSYDDKDNTNIYVLSNTHQQLVQLGPVTPPQDITTMRYWFIGGSYALLALIIGLWLSPLWRDLRNLQLASKQFSIGHPPRPIQVNTTSTISSVLTTFNNMTAQISRLIEEQKQLTNAVSHELRTPLARLKFSFAMLEDKELSQLPAMRDDVTELENLVDEMLNYGRLESEIRSLELSDVNIDQLLTNQVEKLSRHQDKTLKLTIEPNLRWLCDGHFIERACQNYITNALRYAHQQVEITVQIANNSLHISVEDDGVGINKNEREQVFKPFTRLDKSRNKQQGGFGLGLAIVSRITDWHQGQCYVTRSALGGAKFCITLPRLA